MRDLIIRRNRPSDAERIRSDIDRVFADAFFRQWPFQGQDAYPPVDLYATDENLVALVDLPGAESKDVEITATVDSLAITGEIKVSPEKGDLLWQERSGGKFFRSFKLPVAIKADAVEASFKSGVLRITMPKVDEVKMRSVKIKEE